VAILSGRGLALGLTIQPLLHTMLSGLAPAHMADATSLFNVAQRLGGSIGISLLATFFQVRERVHIESVLLALGVPTNAQDSIRGAVAGGTTTVPVSIQEALADAATAGFHDVIALLVMLAALGTAAAFMLRSSRQ
jgi:hypothetical protein